MQKFSMIVNTEKLPIGLLRVTMWINGERFGDSPAPEKLTSIVVFLEPCAMDQLRRYLGMLNFYGRFLPEIDIVASAKESLKDHLCS